MKMEEVDWSRRAENCGVSTVAVHGPGVLSPSLYNDRCQLGYRDSVGSSDSVPRRSLRTFCLATETGTHSANCAVGVVLVPVIMQ